MPGAMAAPSGDVYPARAPMKTGGPKAARCLLLTHYFTDLRRAAVKPTSPSPASISAEDAGYSGSNDCDNKPFMRVV